MDELLVPLLPVAFVHSGDNTPNPNKIPEVVLGVVILPELHQYLLSVFPSFSDILGSSVPEIVGLKSCYNSDALVGSKRWHSEGETLL